MGRVGPVPCMRLHGASCEGSVYMLTCHVHVHVHVIIMDYNRIYFLVSFHNLTINDTDVV